MPTLQELISGALSGVRNPRTGADVMAADMVRDIATTTDGKVRLTMLIGAADGVCQSPATVSAAALASPLALAREEQPAAVRPAAAPSVPRMTLRR